MDMSVDTPLRQALLARIKARRDDVRGFLRAARGGSGRCGTLGVVGSSVAAVLTAGPGVGGTFFTDAMQRAFAIPDAAVVWQGLCLLSTAISIGAAVLVGLDRSKDVAVQLAIAEMTAGELEWLQMMLEYDELPPHQAAKLLQHYNSKIAFVDERDHPVAAPPTPSTTP
jgi:hypothetical protein